MINGSSRRDLLLNSQNFCHSIPAGTENPLPSRLCYRRLWGSRNRRALILGWAYYLDAFSSYPLRTWLPSVYRRHDNWYTRGASFPSSSLLPLHSRANLRPARGNLCTPPLPFGRPTPHRNCLPETVPWPVGPDTRRDNRRLSSSGYAIGSSSRKAVEMSRSSSSVRWRSTKPAAINLPLSPKRCYRHESLVITLLKLCRGSLPPECN
ncbi:hypothetical protein PVK06_033799 [Gossypium arboreum]|uniref:Uncharacterized protein n=1 Tax=Gossypium arboreum TaxID=29729 RepID=A0ABR0NCE9_GOSAR|nr:hypothetical protein PVK06_033799 [Gossypium arboreum]